MPSAWRKLRRRILTPSTSETLLEKRGFHRKTPAAQQLLETVGERFLEGYGYAMEARDTGSAENLLEGVPIRFRGFAYEGAGMGFAMLDGLPLSGSGSVARFLAGRGADHVYMVYIGVGWAMARLPRFRWPDIDALDPLLRWLVLDGYGFHQAYFRTARYVHEQYRDPAFPWPAHDSPSYAGRAIDQGIGRALWFVGGTDADLVATMIEKFPESRRSDLYSGAGLAATYAGGVDEAELRAFWERAGSHRAMVAQGSAFAAEARERAGLPVVHTELATRVFCGMTPAQAARVTQEVRPAGPVPGALPAYEVWRQAIADRFTNVGGC
uniref:UnbL n=1 Tax=Streptomyces citricolor TaxID=212427 RepID=Q84HL4_9ACTN|nr:UnbL [Streptomyces citricolor]